MLDEQMSSTDLTLGHAGDGAVAGSGAVVGGHVVLELLAVGAGGRLPAGDLVDRVEVVGKVLGVGVANLPVRRKTGVRLRGAWLA